MVDLEYRIGEIEVDPKRIEDLHLFVVRGSVDEVKIYISRHNSHSSVVDKYGLGYSRIIGGGLVSLGNNKLRIGGASDKFGSIPKYAIENFGNLVADNLTNQGIKIDEIEINPSDNKIGNPNFWFDEDYRKRFSKPDVMKGSPSLNGYNPFDELKEKGLI